MKNWGKICLMCLALTACSSDKKVAPTEGRISLVEQSELLSSTSKVSLSSEKSQKPDVMMFYNAQNKIPHVKVKTSEISWTGDMDEDITLDLLPLSNVVIDDKQVYALDGDFNLCSFDLKGKSLFQKNLTQKDQPLALALKNGKIIATSVKGQVITTDKKGKILWQKDLQIPFRNFPVIYKEAVYLLSASGDLFVLNINTGKEIWHYKTTTPNTTWWQMGSPAVNNNVVVVPFSNGMVTAFNAENGSFMWEEDLSGAKTFNQFDHMTQMIASPVIEEDTVYLVGHADVSKALNLKTGKKLWEIPVGAKTTPLISGNALFVLDNQNTLYAINKENGTQFWKEQLTLAEGSSTLRLVDKNLYVFNAHQSIKVDPKTGKVKDVVPFKTPVSFPSVTQDGFYFITQDGQVSYKGQLK